MPNCDWFGTQADHVPILDFLFNENECEVYELASEFGQPLNNLKTRVMF